ncbi:hypothetical protein [Saccharopolyspora spinosa]|uniref:Uncharacterized protein n=1 Tax=Saccharopolyspora spinosa TaxID=60894 RepID=A0A2N3Y8N8_SACSN|nr:hypothetical protein [Saccharopolyspora spinosa]PKW19278.1 hypothetical protein A8926_7442 [Saccharopolyspora spinosa]
MRAQAQPQLHELLVRASAVLEDLTDDVRERTVHDGQFAETAEFLAEIAELLRDQNATYVPPRVIDGERAGR